MAKQTDTTVAVDLITRTSWLCYYCGRKLHKPYLMLSWVGPVPIGIRHARVCSVLCLASFAASQLGQRQIEEIVTREIDLPDSAFFA